MNDIQMGELLAGFKPRAASKFGFRHRFVVRDYEIGLLYRCGHLEERLTAGRHVRWGLAGLRSSRNHSQR